MNNISFDNPWLLLLFIPMAVVMLVPFLIAVRKENANVHNVTAICLHMVICACITLAIAGMTFETVVTETNVFVLADISYSTTHNLDDVQESLNKVSEKLPQNSKMGVICFGRNYQLISDFGDGVPDITTATEVDRSATDIAAAMRYAGNLFNEGVIKRIVVITDGKETVSSNSIIKVVSALQDDGVYVDAVYIDDNISSDVREVQIDSVEAVQTTYLNKKEQVSVMVRANCGEDIKNENGTLTLARTDGYIFLYKNGDLVDLGSPNKGNPVSFYNGLNVYSIDIPTDEVGSFDYEVKISTANSDADFSVFNNSCSFTQSVTDERNVLFIGGSAADVAAGRKIYGDEKVTYITDPSLIPLSVEDMCAYDEIVFSNFDVRTVLASQMFLSSISTLVDNYGKTLTTFGNTFVQEDADDPALQKLSGLLPVNVGNNDLDTRLYALVLDISTSMNFGGRLSVAKSAAIEVLKKLKPTDMVMVIGFSGTTREILPPTRLRSLTSIIKTIENLEPEAETNLSAALGHALDLMPPRYNERQIFLISDSLNPKTDTENAIEKARALSENNISITSLGVFPEAHKCPIVNGKVLIQALAEDYSDVKGSKYKQILSESDLDFVIEDIVGDIQEVRIEGDSYQISTHGSNEVLNEIESLPAINGFWYNSAKSTATTVVTAKYYRDRVNSFDIPIYAYWSGGGKGKVVSFTSDITSDWVGNWSVGTDGYKFLGNIPVATLPDERIISPFIVSVETEAGTSSLTVTPSSSLHATTSFTAVMVDPDDLTYSRNLTYNSGVYFANFSTDAPGIYKVHLTYEYNDLKYEADASFTISYYTEYNSFEFFNQTYLNRLTTENGQILNLDEIERIENSDSAYTSYIFEFTVPLMIAAAALLITEIIIRQLKWKDVTSFFKTLFRRKRK